MSLTKSLYHRLSKRFDALNKAVARERQSFPEYLLFALSLLFFHTLFLITSFPLFLRKTQRQSFQELARVDRDGTILDSYARHHVLYHSVVFTFFLTLVLLLLVVMSRVSAAD